MRPPAGSSEGALDGVPGAWIDALVQASFLTMGVLTRVSAENDLSLTQLRVLAILRDRRLRITTLAGYLGLEKSTLSGLIDRAEKRGLVTRAPDAHDGRVVDVLLSPAGRDLAERLGARVQESLKEATADLSPAEQRQLQGLLSRLMRPQPDTDDTGLTTG